MSSGAHQAESIRPSAGTASAGDDEREELLEPANRTPGVQATGTGPWHSTWKIHSDCQAAQVSMSCYFSYFCHWPFLTITKYTSSKQLIH